MPRASVLEHVYQHLSHRSLRPQMGGSRRLQAVGEDVTVSETATPGQPRLSPRPTTGSADWFERAHRVTPGGVNSPVRAFNAVGGTPRFMASGRRAWVRHR